MKTVFMKAFMDDDPIADPNNDSTKIITEQSDILCGIDKTSLSHTGNRRFKVIIEMNREKYQTPLVSDEKTCITTKIVTMIQ